mmetsp:Transcript_14224/g.34698  ORF Transcript_14224/g.34698 Transcript_14224/m.34698 type:complete len:110 (-) Transcript_14224:1252-1581(-)
MLYKTQARHASYLLLYVFHFLKRRIIVLSGLLIPNALLDLIVEVLNARLYSLLPRLSTPAKKNAPCRTFRGFSTLMGNWPYVFSLSSKVSLYSSGFAITRSEMRFLRSA